MLAILIVPLLVVTALTALAAIWRAVDVAIAAARTISRELAASEADPAAYRRRPVRLVVSNSRPVRSPVRRQLAAA